MSALPPGFSTSGDLALDRRYRWAAAALAAGEAAEAGDIIEQVLAQAPRWAPAHMLLGEAHLAASDRERAIAAFRAAADLDPDGRLGATLALARLGAAPASMPDGYVAALFDDYADRFDAHLVGALRYRGPQVVMAALRGARAAASRDLAFGRALDLGCGTGLMGEAIRPWVDRLTGVDLSPGMIAKARARLVYDGLEVAGLLPALAAEPAERLDLVLAADVLCYVGDLGPVAAATARVLVPGGLFAFTVQALDAPDGFRLGADNRFAHSAGHVRSVAMAAGLSVAWLADAVSREDEGADVAGIVAVLERTS